jgi:coenzyme F420-0:L-glutamate ligase / coenzyme F420-1:gamma-L-glutamate ligase
VTRLVVLAPDGVGEVGRGADLAAMVAGLVELQDGDVVLVTSKVVSKAEGRVVPGSREDALPGETERVVARRGPTRIVRTRHGLTLAAAGIDASNVAPGQVVLLPVDPDESARRLRARVAQIAGVTVGVVVTDTAGRAWREGQTDIAVGAAGIRVLEDFAGRRDDYGNDLAVTAPAVADELAGAAELAQGKLGQRPFAVVRGRADLVLPTEDDGPGAVGLVRPDAADLFGYGAREAVVRALGGRPGDRPGFGAPATAEELADAVEEVTGRRPAPDGVALVADGPPDVLRALAFAHGWELEEPDGASGGRLLPLAP